MPGKIVHFELPAADADRASGFWNGLFGWGISESAMPEMDYRMAQVSYLKGDLQDALASIRRALQLNPLEPEYYYVLARCLEDTDPRAALEAIQKAVGFRPGVPDFEDLLRELNSKAASKCLA